MFQAYFKDKLLYRPGDSVHTIFSPKLKLSIGKAGTFSFSILPENPRYSELGHMKTGVSVFLDDKELFRGRVFSNERGFQNIRKIECEGDLSYLIDSVQKGARFSGMTHDLYRQIVANHNAMVEAEKQFVAGIIGIENREIVLAGQSDEFQDLESDKFDYRQIAINASTENWQTSYDHIETCLTSYCGGYLFTRHEDGVTYLDLKPDSGNVAVQSIDFGVNLLDLTEQINADELFTVLIPLGDDNLTIESVNNGSIELVDNEAVAQYGRIVKTHVFDGVNSADTLLENGQRFLESNIPNAITITIKAIDLHLLDSAIPAISVGDRVRIHSYPHGIQSTFLCTDIEYDLENPGNTVYTFGTPHQTLTERYRKDRVKQSYGSSGYAGAVAEEAAEEVNEKLTEKYDAWIEEDPENGRIGLQTLYESYDEFGDAIEQHRTAIRGISSDTKAHIELITTVSKHITGSDAELDMGDCAEILMDTYDDMTSKIEMNATTIELHAKELIDLSTEMDGNMAGLELRLTNSETDAESIWDAIAALTVTVGDTTTGLLARVTNAEADILAGTELYIKEADLEAKIGVYKMADGLTMAQMQADLVSLRANLTAEIQAKLVNITGMVNVSGGSMTVNGNLSVTGAYAIQALTGTVIAKKLGTSSEFWIKGVEYKPTNITSTTGTVKVLGAA